MGRQWTQITYITWYLPKKLRHLPRAFYEFYCTNRDFIREYRRFRPDYVHGCSGRSFQWLALSAWCLRAQTIFRLGDAPSDKGLQGWLWRHWLVKTVGRFYFVSEFIRQRVLYLGRSPDKNDMVIRPKMPIRRQGDTAPLPAPLTAQLERLRESRRLIMVYFGRISRAKGVELLYEAIKKLNAKYPGQCGWLLVGESGGGDDALFHRIASDIASRSVEGVLLPGFVKNIPDLLKYCDVHIAPSICNEAFGNVVVEAKRAGLPSIIFPDGGLPELVCDRETGLVCAQKDIEAIIDGVEYYLQNPRQVELQGRNALLSCETLKLTPQFFDAQIECLYE